MGQQQQQFGDTTLTKVFVGGLAWETQKEALRDHFHHFGDILEAVIISDKLTGRSKGYGFVTFKEAEAAKKACEDASPVINGRRANCNLASLGAKTRLRPSPPTTPAPPTQHHHLHHHPHQPAGVAVGSRGIASGPPAPWYYQPSGTPPPPPPPLPTPFHGPHHHYHGVLPFYAAAAAAAAYGYSPYVTDLSYDAKLSHAGGGGPYLQGGQFSYPAHGAGMVATAAAANGMVPVYPYYHYHHHQSQGMGVPAAHFFPPATTAGSVAAIPAIISKPTTAIPASTVEQVTGCS